jgi:hypothetical protein
MFGNGLAATSPVGFFMFNHPDWPNLAAVECLSRSAGARLASLGMFAAIRRASLT